MDNVISIDIAPLFTGDEPAWTLVDQQILGAIRQHGGFVIAGFPDADRIDTLASTMVRFFDLDETEKLKTAKAPTRAGATNLFRGYDFNLKPGSFAYNEMFDVGPETPSPAITEGSRAFAEENVWPETEPVNGWREAMESYYGLLHRTGMAVLHSVGRSLDLPADRLDRMFRTGNSTLRLINYPVPPEDGLVTRRGADEEDLKISTASHTDGSGLSVLWSLQRGLQARAPDGTWRDIPQQTNCLSIHVGDVVEAMTDGQVPATPHRVLGHGIERQSIGFFLEPRLDAQLGFIGNAEADGAVQNTYGWLLQKRYSGYDDYKGLIDSPE